MAKKTSKKLTIYRQGDVNLVKVDDMDFSGAEEIKAENGRAILAHGEVTGHFHSVPAAAAKQFRLGDKEFLKVNKDCEITHQEHAAFKVPQGTYQKVIAREYLEAGKTRQVVD